MNPNMFILCLWCLVAVISRGATLNLLELESFICIVQGLELREWCHSQ